MRRGSRLVEPDRIQAHDVEDAEIGGRIETLDVIVPDLVDPFPGDRQQRRAPPPDGLGLAAPGAATPRVALPRRPGGPPRGKLVVPRTRKSPGRPRLPNPAQV